MKRAALFATVFLLVVPQIANADIHVATTGDSSVNVSSQTSGTSTTCINGNCTTTGGGSHTTATVNGKTYESNGDLNVDDGNSHVHVNSSSGNTSASVNNSSSSTTINSTSESGSKDKDADEDDKDDDQKPSSPAAKITPPSQPKIAVKIHKNLVQLFFSGISGIFHRLFTAFK